MSNEAVGWKLALGVAAAVVACDGGGGRGGPSPATGVDVSCASGMYIERGVCRALPMIGAPVAAVGPDGGDDADASLAGDGDDAGDAGAPFQPDLTTASAFLINAAHTGVVSGTALMPPLEQLWDVPLTGPVSYPVVANGLVFVAAGADGGTDTTVTALDDATGTVVWSADLGMVPSASLAYEQGLLFEVDSGIYADLRPFIRAYEAATGRLVWMTATDDNQDFFDPPTAYRGIIYVYGSGTGSTLYAYDENTGALLWQRAASGSWGAPAVSDDGVFVGDPCHSAFGVDRTKGTILWQNKGPCSGGGGTAPTLLGGALYVRDPVLGDSLLLASTGVTLGTFKADFPPAFGLGLGFYVSSGILNGGDKTLASSTWTFAPGGAGVVTAPLVVGGYVYVESSEGDLFAIDGQSGAPVWSGRVGTPSPFQESFDRAPTALAAAHGVLVVPAGNDVVAFGSAGPRAAPVEGGDGASD